MRVLLAFLLIFAAQLASAQAPEKAQWETNMTVKGDLVCDTMATKTPAENLGSTYYDGQRVFQNIYNYTSNADWLDCAEYAETAYRDNYVTPNNGNVPGYWLFSRGLRMDFERDGDTASRTAVGQLSSNGTYCNETTPIGYTNITWRGRELGYCLMANLDAEALGFTQSPRRNTRITQALNLLDKWFISQTSVCDHAECIATVPWCANKFYINVLYVGIIFEALIQAWEVTGDSTIVTTMQAALDQLWIDAKIDGGMWFNNCTDTAENDGTWQTVAPACDLNPMIAPAYEWMYQRTGIQGYRDKADTLHQEAVGAASNGECAAGGGAFIFGHKQFNQSYRWSPTYIASREDASTLTISTTSAGGGTNGVAYTQEIVVTGGTLPLASCTISAGNLPDGLSIDLNGSDDGCTISGTPTVSDDFTFTVLVTDDEEETDDQELTITILDASSNLAITTTTAPDGLVGQVDFGHDVDAEGGTPPYTFTVQSGSLCQGTTLNASTGEISGTPTTAGQCSYTIRVTDDDENTDDQAFSPTVSNPAGEIVGTVIPGSISAVLKWGYAGMDSAADCEANVYREAEFVSVAVSSSGQAKRMVGVTGLSASTDYTVRLDCAGALQESVSFRTLASSSGTQPVTFSTGPPIPALTTAARWSVECADNEALTNSTTVQDKSIGSGASLTHVLTQGLYYCRSKWQTSGDTVLATTSVQPVPVPSGVSAASLATGVVHHYTMDEASGDREDGVGSADWSEGNTPGSDTGINGDAAEVSPSDYLAINTADLLPTTFTLAFWVKPSSFMTIGGAPVLASSTISHGIDIVQLGSGTSVGLTIYPSATTATLTGDPLSTGSWHLVVAWFDVVTGEGGIQIDAGTPATLTGATLSVASGTTFIPFNDLAGMSGLVDELTVWSRVLTSSDRLALWNSGAGRFYPFN